MTANVLEKPENHFSAKHNTTRGMQEFGEAFILKLPKHIASLKIHGRKMTDSDRKDAVLAFVNDIDAIQSMMTEVLLHPTTLQAQFYTEQAFLAFLDKKHVDDGLLKFFNG
ncbi:hypothetical protein [Gynuella sunshinyii]|uniref:hypothetical protein n=1 Tax=Gynuella sunshinyii TaxID=1445505 RepID=UPI001B80E4EA|nr:hypothetical protein [Gynuella sunshinyii]